MKGGNKNVAAEVRGGGELMPTAAQTQNQNVTREGRDRRDKRKKATLVQADNQSRSNAVTTFAEKKKNPINNKEPSSHATLI